MSSDDEVWRLARELTIDGERNNAIAKLTHIGATSVPILIRFLGQGSATSPGQQRGAIQALAGIGDVAVPALVECLNTSPDGWARLGAADALSIQGKGYLAVPALTALLQGSPDTGRFAAIALGRMGEAGRPALPALTTMMKSHPLNWSRVDAAAALARLGETKKAVPVLIGFLRDRQCPCRSRQ